MVDVPVIVSHTGIHAHCPVKRNFLDALVQQIAAVGGLIAIGIGRRLHAMTAPKE